MRLFGISSYFLPLYLFGYAVYFALNGEAVHPHLKKVGGLVLFASSSAFFGLQGETSPLFGEQVRSGGLLGSAISYLLLTGFSATGAYIITVTAITAALMLLTPFSPLKAIAWLQAAWNGLMDQLDLLITIQRGRREKAKEAKQRTVLPKEAPKIIDAKQAAAMLKEPRPEKQPKPKPVQATFEFMETRESKDGVSAADSRSARPAAGDYKKDFQGGHARPVGASGA